MDKPANPGTGTRGTGPPDGVLFTARYADEGPFPFRDGTRMRFGRDDDACEITVWEQLLTSTLSKVAGELWCANGRMWVQNVSTAHELVVEGKDEKTTLRARLPDEPGDARSIPFPDGAVSAPSTGSWRIVVERSAPLRWEQARAVSADGGDPTTRFGDVPEPMWATANALCEPLLHGSSEAASHAEVGRVLGISDRAGRRRVEELCEHYRNQVAALPGGQRRGETLTEAVARLLVERRKVPAPPPPGSALGGRPGSDGGQ